MVEVVIVNAVVFGGSVMGGFARAFFPYLRKLKEQEDLEGEGEKPIRFQRKYVYTSIFSVILALIVGMTLYPSLIKDIDPAGLSDAALAGIFMSSFLAAWGANDIINNVVATGRQTREIKPANPLKPTEGAK